MFTFSEAHPLRLASLFSLLQLRRACTKHTFKPSFCPFSVSPQCRDVERSALRQLQGLIVGFLLFSFFIVVVQSCACWIQLEQLHVCTPPHSSGSFPVIQQS